MAASHSVLSRAERTEHAIEASDFPVNQNPITADMARQLVQLLRAPDAPLIMWPGLE